MQFLAWGLDTPINKPICLEIEEQKSGDEMMHVLRENSCVYGMLFTGDVEEKEPTSYVLPENVLDYTNEKDIAIIDQICSHLTESEKKASLFIVINPNQLLAMPKERLIILSSDLIN